MAVMRVGTKKKLPEGLGTRARAWPEGGMLAGPAEARRKMGGGKGGPGGGRPQRDPSCPLLELSPPPTSHPKSVIPQPTPVPQFSGGLALRGVDAWVVCGEAARSWPGDGRGANQTTHDLSTLNSSARLWTCLLVMPGMWMKYRHLFKLKFQVNNG